MTKKIIEFETFPTPSLNQLKGRWALVNYKRKYQRLLKGYELFRLKEKKKVRLTYQRHGSRLLDSDNLMGGTKNLTDVLKEKGLMVDDCPEWCEIVMLPQVKCPRGKEKIWVKIEEI